MRFVWTSLIFALAAFPVCAKSPLAGVWGREEYNCGGLPCSQVDIVNHVAELTFEGLRLEVVGHRICGVWYGDSEKFYRGFVVGTVIQGKASIVYGQEIDHAPNVYGINNYSLLPAFTPLYRGRLRLARGQLEVQRTYNPPNRYFTFLYKRVPMARLGYWGLAKPQQWEPEFIASCFSGTDPAIEQALHDMAP